MHGDATLELTKTAGLGRQNALTHVVGGDLKKQNVLHLAAENRPLLLPLLLREGARDIINDANSDGLTPLLIACIHQVQAVEVLVEAGADVHAVTRMKESALMLACANQPEAVDKLLASGVDVTATDVYGRNALHHAVGARNSHVLSALLAAGCDIFQSTQFMGSPMNALELAQYHGDDESIAPLRAKQQQHILRQSLEEPVGREREKTRL